MLNFLLYLGDQELIPFKGIYISVNIYPIDTLKKSLIVFTDSKEFQNVTLR